MLLAKNAEIHVSAPSEANFRICTGCKQAKPHAFFHLKGLDKFGTSRYQSTCKKCANKNRVLQYQKKKLAKKRIKKANKRFDLSSCDIKIIHVGSDSSSQKIIGAMADYIEAVYAISI